ncbi:ring zinc finger domain superfamily protein [Stylonychia lemnae]|uniref:RING-type E3 ubiquitin transferase n=1 Tax=Stylonychia lemnae TaxID=5949 RepID=A0A078A0J6_STYLE|nr:ring zinc finger domain superfamily protein [Stylonychia lemnae]|eukprot:CDW74978.1 ring zinc finger domain superfamily protein [Stylonychia lemnae]
MILLHDLVLGCFKLSLILVCCMACLPCFIIVFARNQELESQQQRESVGGTTSQLVNRKLNKNLSEQQLKQLLRSIFFKKKTTFLESQAKVDTCSICLEQFQDIDDIIRLNCDEGHIFHFACLEGWAMTNNSCPLCRKNLIDEKDLDIQQNFDELSQSRANLLFRSNSNFISIQQAIVQSSEIREQVGNNNINERYNHERDNRATPLELESLRSFENGSQTRLFDNNVQQIQRKKKKDDVDTIQEQYDEQNDTQLINSIIQKSQRSTKSRMKKDSRLKMLNTAFEEEKQDKDSQYKKRKTRKISEVSKNFKNKSSIIVSRNVDSPQLRIIEKSTQDHGQMKKGIKPQNKEYDDSQRLNDNTIKTKRPKRNNYSAITMVQNINFKDSIQDSKVKRISQANDKLRIEGPKIIEQNDHQSTILESL